MPELQPVVEPLSDPSFCVLHMRGLCPTAAAWLWWGVTEAGIKYHAFSAPPGQIEPQTEQGLRRVLATSGWNYSAYPWVWRDRMLVAGGPRGVQALQDLVSLAMCGKPAWRDDSLLIRERFRPREPMVVVGSMPGEATWRYYRVNETLTEGVYVARPNGSSASTPELRSDPALARLVAGLQDIPGIDAGFRIEPESISIMADDWQAWDHAHGRILELLWNHLSWTSEPQVHHVVLPAT